MSRHSCFRPQRLERRRSSPSAAPSRSAPAACRAVVVSALNSEARRWWERLKVCLCLARNIAYPSPSYCAFVSYILLIHQASPQIFERHVKPQVDAAMEDTPVVVIVGPRQSGKSTLAGLVAQERNARQVTLADAGPRAAANADPTR